MIDKMLARKRELEREIEHIDEIVSYVQSKSDLSEREEYVFNLRKNKENSLQFIADSMGNSVSRERVRQIERRAIDKMSESRAWGHKICLRFMSYLRNDDL